MWTALLRVACCLLAIDSLLHVAVAGENRPGEQRLREPKPGDQKIEPPKFKIAAKRGGTIDITATANAAIFNIHSPEGIGHADLELVSGRWPASVVLRLQLKGLEGFQVSNGKVAIEAAVSSSDPKRPRVRKDDVELDHRSPYWIPLRFIDKDGKPAQNISPDGGHIELQLPPALFEGAGKEPARSIRVHWVDFYRG